MDSSNKEIIEKIKNTPLSIGGGTTLIAVNADWRNKFPDLAMLCSKWRQENPTFTNSEFVITNERTAKWLDINIAKADDSVLFIINSEQYGAIGHIGFDIAADNSVWISRVCRGEKYLPGIMGRALKAICNLLFAKFNVAAIFLDCYADNLHAIKFYKDNNFMINSKKELCQKYIDGELKWVECTKEDKPSRTMLIFSLSR